MNKGIKIKAYTILSAWLIIFMHAVIPHNHLEENSGGCHDLIHSIASDDKDCNNSSEFKNQPEDVTICHFSNLLFNHFNEENILISSTGEAHFHQVVLTISFLSDKTEIFLSEPYYGSSSLRAPPSI